MQQITLNLSPELYINDHNQLSIKASKDEGNALTLLHNSLEDGECGLYLESTNAYVTGTTYPNGETEGILIGQKSPWDEQNALFDSVVGVASYVHRVFTAFQATKTEHGYYAFPSSSLIDLRQCDYIIPGDFIRVPDMEFEEDKTYTSLSDIPEGTKFFYFIVASAIKETDDDGIMPHNDVPEAYLLREESW